VQNSVPVPVGRRREGTKKSPGQGIAVLRRPTPTRADHRPTKKEVTAAVTLSVTQWVAVVAETKWRAFRRTKLALDQMPSIGRILSASSNATATPTTIATRITTNSWAVSILIGRAESESIAMVARPYCVSRGVKQLVVPVAAPSPPPAALAISYMTVKD
jgi:hypothetical protein